MFDRPPLPLRAYLAGLVGLFVLSAAVSTVSLHMQAGANAQAVVMQDAAFAADLGASEIANGLDAVEAAVVRASTSSAVAAAYTDPTGCVLNFGGSGVFPSLRVDLMRPDGTVVCSSVPRPASEPASHAGASWLEQARGGRIFEAPAVDRVTGLVSAVIAAPLTSGGIAAAFVDLSGLGPLLSRRFGGADHPEFLVTTADGTRVIARSKDPTQWAGRSLEGTPFAVTEERSQRLDVDGDARIYASSTAGGHGWKVYAGIDTSLALTQADELFRQQIAQRLLGLLALLAFTTLIYRRISRPISELRRSIGTGLAGRRPITVSGPSEIVDLANAFNDLIGRLRAELAERQKGMEAQARLAALVGSTTDAVIRSRLDGTVTDWNPGAERLFGYRADEVVGTRPLAVLPPGDEARRDAELARVGEGERVERFETTRVRKDGSLVEISISAAPIFDEDGTVTAVATVARDISDLRANERKRIDLEARLRQAERLESVGRLAGGIAHDFNNLLAIVLNYCDFISQRLAPEDPNHEDLEQIRAAAQRATAFTRQLLTFARSGPVSAEDLDVAQLVRGVETFLRRSLRESIGLELDIAADLWAIRADKAQIEQVLLNLVVNSRDAMPGGGVLRVGLVNVEHDLDSAGQYPDLVPGRYVQLTVTDSGQGMPKEVLERAFEPFFTTKPTGKGTGLGLATVYGVVRQAGGRVSLYSEVGRGTTVRVLLPATGISAPDLRQPARSEGSVTPRGRATILVVEDQEGIRAAAERILTAHGYAVLQAGQPETALALLRDRDQPLDLLLTDMVMPGMSGRDLARRLRADRPGLRVLYMTGYSEDLLRGDLPNLEGPVMQKPFTRAPLLSAVAAALGDKG